MDEVKKDIKESLDIFIGAFFGAMMGVFMTYLMRMIEEAGELRVNHLAVGLVTFTFILVLIISTKVLRDQGHFFNFIQQFLFFLMGVAYLGALYFSYLI